MKIECMGMYFNESSIDEDELPATELTIEKDVLDRSSGYIIGRFAFEIESRSKIVFEVTVDGRKVDDYGTNLPYMETSGNYDTTLFKYPNSAKANKNGKHKVHVKYGLIAGVVESQEGLIEWGDIQAIGEADFIINLLPHKIE